MRCQQIAQAELGADGLRFLEIGGRKNGRTSQKQIERECFGQHVILVELRRGGQVSAPFGGAESLAIESVR